MNDEEYHLLAAEYHLACARGQDLEIHPAMFRMPTAPELAELRQKCGLTQSEVAKKIGYSSVYIADVEGGGSAPGRDLIQKLITLYRHEWPAGEDVEEVMQA